MNKLALWTTLILLPSIAVPVQAQGIFGIFGRKTTPRGPAAQRVPELIMTLKTDSDERRRANAAEELGQFDAATYAEITPVLVEALLNDPRPGVRMEAGSALGALRPASQAAANALDKSASNDDNWRVRIHSKGIGLKYRWAGIPSQGNSSPAKSIRTEEPPLFEPQGIIAPPVGDSPMPPAGKGLIGAVPAGPVLIPQAPSAKSASADSSTPQFRPAMPRPLPQGPFTTAAPQKPAASVPAPLPMATEGPMLEPAPMKTPF